MSRQPINISTTQKLVFQATLKIAAASRESVGSLLALLGTTQAFMDKHELSCTITFHDETRTDDVSAKLDMHDTTMLTGSLVENAKKAEMLHRFFARHGFDSQIVFGNTVLFNPAPEPETADWQLIEDTPLDLATKTGLLSIGIETVQKLTATRSYDLLFKGWTMGELSELQRELEPIGLSLRPDVSNKIRDLKLQDIDGISTDTVRRLQIADATTIGKLLDYHLEVNLRTVSGLKHGGMEEIEAALSAHGINLP